MSDPSTPVIGADLVVRRLRAWGVGVVFGYPGGQLTPLYDALHRDGTIRHVLARDEQAAAFMADGYARATGRPGVLCVVPGPGVTNALTGLGEALLDSSPVVANGVLYAAREDGMVFAARVGEKFELLGENPLGERIIASPVPAGNCLLLRTDRHLYCIAAKKP